MQIGIRLHDVNAALGPEYQTLEQRLAKANEEGFSCVHLALAKVIQGVTFDGAAFRWHHLDDSVYDTLSL